MTEEPSSEKPRRSLTDSLRFAFRGIKVLLRQERNFRIHLAIAAIVCLAAGGLGFSPLEWTILLLTIGFVIVAEVLNSAVETLVDLVEPRQHPLAGKAKDVAAGAVLIAAFISVMIGLLLFVPPLWNLVSRYLELT